MKNVQDLAYQFEAKTAVLKELSTQDRAQVIMCCGSGKTYTQAMITNDFLDQYGGPDSVILCLVPNKGLIYQNAKNYKAILGDKVEYLGVCSDQEYDEISEDEDSTLAVTTDPEKINEFSTSRKKPKVIFTTYQSAETTRNGLTKEDGSQLPVALGNFDEAHRTAGDKDKDSQFAFALFQENFDIDKRVFYTATPKIKNSRAVPEIAMNDTAMYGRVVYNYPFSRARAEGRVTDYNLYVPIVRKSEVEALMAASGLTESQQREAVSEIAIQKIIEETGQTRFLSFHRTIARSKSFAKRMSSVLKDQGFTVRHMDGTIKKAERKTILAGLEEDKNLVTNAKALTEGVDAPGLQGLLFVDPKGSLVDIIQALGRATRIDPNDPDKVASIVAPVLIDDQSNKSIEEQASEQGFKNLFMVAEALRANDDTFNIHIRDKSREAGKSGEIPEFGSGFLKVVDANTEAGPAGGDRLSDLDLDAIRKGISLAAFNNLKDSFAEKVGQIEAYAAQHGELPTSKSDPKLAAFIQLARRNQKLGKMSEEDTQMLEEVPGWHWGRTQRSFQDNLNDLEKCRKEGKKFPSDTSSALGKFVRKMRNDHAKGILPPERADALDKLDGWIWSTDKSKLYENLEYFYERKKHSPDPQSKSHAEASLGRQLRSFEETYAIAKEEDAYDPLAGTGIGKSFTLCEIQNSKMFYSRIESPGDKKHEISGALSINDSAKLGEPNVYFHPNPEEDEKCAYFETGIRGKPRRFGIHATSEELERISELPPRHKITVTLGRASIHSQAFDDAKIKKWHSAFTDFKEDPGSEKKVSYLLARLKDRKISGRPAYTAENIKSGKVSPDQTVTTLNRKINPMPVKHVRGLIGAVRRKALEASLPSKICDQLDEAPGFAWVEAASKSPALADTVKMITARHGSEILRNAEARKGDNGLANSLREIDTLVSQKNPSDAVRSEVRKLKNQNLLVPLLVKKKNQVQTSDDSNQDEDFR